MAEEQQVGLGGMGEGVSRENYFLADQLGIVNVWMCVNV